VTAHLTHRRGRTGALAGLVGALIVWAGLVISAGAQTSITVVDERVISPDPRAITFEVQVSGAPLVEAVLMHRRANPDGALGGEIRAEIPSRGTGVIQAELSTNGAQVYIPSGTEFTYHWVLRGTDGSVVETSPQTFVFLDGQFNWRLLEDRGIRLYHYGNDDRARSVLNASADAITELEVLLQTEVPFPVTLVLWGGGSDGTYGQRSRGGVYSDQSITGGARVAPDIVHVYNPLGLTFEDIARHEVGHVVTRQAGRGSTTDIPSWIDEGVATYIQRDKGSRVPAVNFAIQSDTTLRLRNMVAPTNRPELIDIFYGQSWRTVEYMVDTYGADQFAAVFASIKSGNRIDDALIEVYGVDLDGLYNDWRESVGLPRLEFAETSSAIARPEATRAPLAIPTSIAAGSRAGADTGAGTAAGSGTEVASPAASGSSNTTTAIIIGAVTLLLAGALGGVGLRLMRSGR